MASSGIMVDDSIFDISSVPKLSSPVQEYEHIKYQSGRSDTDLETTTSQIQIDVNNKVDFVRFSDSRLEVKCQILKADNATAHTTNVATIPHVLHLFKKIELWCGNEQVNVINHCGPIACALNVLSSSKADIEDLENEMFYIDEPPKRDGVLLSIAGANADHLAGSVNHQTGPIIRAGGTGAVATALTDESLYTPDSVGTQKRLLRTGSSKEFTMSYPLRKLFNNLDVYDRCTRGSRWMIKLERASNAEALYQTYTGTGGDISAFRIKALNLWTPRVKPSLEIEARLLSSLDTGMKVQFPYLHLSEHRFGKQAYTAGSHTHLWTVPYRPVKIVAFFQLASRVETIIEESAPTNNDYAYSNGGVFDNMNITNCHILVDSRQFPQIEYRQSMRQDIPAINTAPYNEADEDVDRLYKAFKEFDGVNTETIISKDTFRRSYPLFCFDVSYPNDVYKNQSNYDIQFNFTIGPLAENREAYCTILSWGEALGEFNVQRGVMSYSKRPLPLDYK